MLAGKSFLSVFSVFNGRVRTQKPVFLCLSSKKLSVGFSLLAYV